MPLKLLNWNAEWAAAKWKAEEMRRHIGQHAADIVCLTETDTARLTLPGIATPSAPRPREGCVVNYHITGSPLILITYAPKVLFTKSTSGFR